MEAQRDDVDVKDARKTWGHLQRMRVELGRLWAELFTEVAREAGLPPPQMQPAIASYEDRKQAAALAKRLRALLGVEVLQFTVRGHGTTASRYCVSLNN